MLSVENWTYKHVLFSWTLFSASILILMKSWFEYSTVYYVKASVRW